MDGLIVDEGWMIEVEKIVNYEKCDSACGSLMVTWKKFWWTGCLIKHPNWVFIDFVLGRRHILSVFSNNSGHLR